MSCRWHDRGWRNLDDNPPLDPKTGLPYNLGETPLPVIMLTSSSSPEHNEARHPYCGLIDSMHIWGLYNGRYGFSDKVLLDAIPDEHRAMVDCMLSLEYQRQTRLKAELAADPETAPWVEEKRLFTNYKLLQLFDTMALYFNCTHEAGRGESTFTHVPRDLSNDVDVRIRPEGDNSYSVSPLSVPRKPCGGLVPGPLPDPLERRRNTRHGGGHARYAGGTPDRDFGRRLKGAKSL